MGKCGVCCWNIKNTFLRDIEAKALNIKKYIKEYALNGEFFVHNLIRNKE